ncbi:hypothetical protein MVEN_01933400 [Mycena venus]|uniref:Phosphatases II n=1 Tax=Mycena venus TaxID=2733690 RepID=A0A8H7CJM6_9AGAR|nr:hypothetical protein MVEN_01933400 [Mycena venus]
MADFFSAVGDGLNGQNNNLPDDTKTFADAIAARFGQADNVLTARLLPPVLRMPSTPMANLSIQQPSTSATENGDCTAVLPAALSEWLDDPRTLVVDIRPHAAYSSARIIRAVSLSVPSTLLKRPLFSLQRLSAMLPSHSARTQTSNIQGLLRKFRAEAPDAPIALAWVQGGFQAVWQARRDLVDAVPPTPETETEDDADADDDARSGESGGGRGRILRAHHLPRAAFALASTTQAPRSAGKLSFYPNANYNMHSGNPSFTANSDTNNAGLGTGGPSYLDPGANPANTLYGTTRPADSPAAAYNPFYDAVRQNTELSHGITERIPLRLPRRWLRDIAKRAAPVTPPDANTAATGRGFGAQGYGGNLAATYGGGGPYGAFRGRKPTDSSEDENENSGVENESSEDSSANPASLSPLHAPAADVEEGTEALAMQFYRIELAEQRRMMGVMEHHSKESGVGGLPEEQMQTGEDKGYGCGDGWDGDVERVGRPVQEQLNGLDDVEYYQRERVEYERDGRDEYVRVFEQPLRRASSTSGSSGSSSSATAPTMTERRRKGSFGSTGTAGMGSTGVASVVGGTRVGFASGGAEDSTSGRKGKSAGGKSGKSGETSGSGGSGSSGSSGGFPFSITAGVEKGSKNRYRNIWPFEHARVRLHKLAQGARAATAPSPISASASGSASTSGGAERAQTYPALRDPAHAKGTSAPPPTRADSEALSVVDEAAIEADVEEDEEYDNYINASHVQPLGTRRRYIATQGPLEATFGDFWTLVWQQNIHVIVMLTREVEGAMIKCGAYWRPGTYGPLRVELLGCAAEGCRGECSLCSAEAGAEPGGGGFFNTGPHAAPSPRSKPMSPHSPLSPLSPRSSTLISPHSPSSRSAYAPPTPPTAPPGQLIKRRLRLTHAAYPTAPPRAIVQLHYLGWPDMNVPEDARGVLGLVWEVGKVVEEVGREDVERTSKRATAAAQRTSGSAPTGDAMDQDQDNAAAGSTGEGTDEGDGSGSDSEVDVATGVLRRALRVGDAAAPVLLHCSAGVGRTGGFIAVDAVLDAVRQEAREMYAAGGGGVGASTGSAARSVGIGSLGSGGSTGGTSEGIGGISAGMRASGISASSLPDRTEEEDDRMDVDIEVEIEDADADMHEGRGMRTPMQIDSAGMEIGLGTGDMGETRRWAERVADTKVLSAFAPASLPSTAFPTSTATSSTGSTASFPSSTLGSPFQFQFQPPAHRSTFSLNLPVAHKSLPTAPSSDSHSQNPENKSSSLPFKMPAAGSGAVPLSVRRGYADHRLRTFSAPTAAPAPPVPTSTSSSPWLLPPKPSSNSPLPGKVLSDRPLANSPLPDRPRSLSPFSAAGPSQHSMQFLDSGVQDPGEQPAQLQHVDYKEPRALHNRGNARPVRLSAFEDPIWEVVQDMREQRMSLCQSLRQYVFVHAAIIEGALMVVDEERARAGIVWRPASACADAAERRFRLRSAATSTTSATSSTGKRLASPTELPKEDKKGEIALSKRPSIKRKQASADEYTNPLATFPPP